MGLNEMNNTKLRLGIVFLTGLHLVAAAPNVSQRLSSLCLEKSTNTAEACSCLGVLAENRLGMREQQIILARKEGREKAVRALMKGLDISGAITLVKNLKNFGEAVRKDCKIDFRMKPG